MNIKQLINRLKRFPSLRNDFFRAKIHGYLSTYRIEKHCLVRNIFMEGVTIHDGAVLQLGQS